MGSIARVAEELDLVEQTLRNWVKAGKLNPAGAKPIDQTTDDDRAALVHKSGDVG